MKSGMNFSAKIQKVRTAVTKTSAPESGPGRPGSSEEVGDSSLMIFTLVHRPFGE